MTTDNVLVTEKVSAEPAAPAVEVIEKVTPMTEAMPAPLPSAPVERAAPVENKVQPAAPKMTKAEFVEELEKLIARGNEAGLESLQIITSLYARQSTKKIASVFEDILEGLAGP